VELHLAWLEARSPRPMRGARTTWGGRRFCARCSMATLSGVRHKPRKAPPTTACVRPASRARPRPLHAWADPHLQRHAPRPPALGQAPDHGCL